MSWRCLIDRQSGLFVVFGAHRYKSGIPHQGDGGCMPPIPSQVHGRMSTVYDEVVQEVHFRGKTVRDDINIGRVQPWERTGLKRVGENGIETGEKCM